MRRGPSAAARAIWDGRAEDPAADHGADDECVSAGLPARSGW
jgi:hypothetical protein